MGRLIESFEEFEDYVRLVESEDVNEFFGIGKWLKKKFGSDYKDLDVIMDRIEEEERKYWSDWYKNNLEINKERALSRTQDDTAIKLKHTERSDRLLKLSRFLDEKKSKTIDNLEKQAQLIIKGDDDLNEYYIAKKLEMQERILSATYRKARKESSKETMDALYKNWKETFDELKKRDQEFQSSHGVSIIDPKRTASSSKPAKKAEPIEKTIKQIVDKKGDTFERKKELLALYQMDIEEFKNEVNKISKEEAEDLKDMLNNILHIKMVRADQDDPQVQDELEDLNQKSEYLEEIIY